MLRFQYSIATLLYAVFVIALILSVRSVFGRFGLAAMALFACSWYCMFSRRHRETGGMLLLLGWIALHADCMVAIITDDWFRWVNPGPMPSYDRTWHGISTALGPRLLFGGPAALAAMILLAITRRDKPETLFRWPVICAAIPTINVALLLVCLHFIFTYWP